MKHRDDVTGEADVALSRRDWLRLAAAGAVVATIGPAGVLGQATPRAASAPTTTDAFKFPLGANATVTIVSDGTVDLSPRELFPKVPAADLVKACEAHALSPDRYACPLNVAMIERGTQRLLIDAGAGTLAGPTAGHLVANLRRAGIEPDTITDVAITHGDPEQVGGLLDAAGKPTFANATVWLEASLIQYLRGIRPVRGDESPLTALEKVKRVAVAARVNNVIRPRVKSFRPGQGIADEMVGAMFTIGHAPQHLSFLSKVAGDREDEILFLGDMATILDLQLAHPEWEFGADYSPKQAIAARRKDFANYARLGLTIVSPRATFPGVGTIVVDGDGFRWKPRA